MDLRDVPVRKEVRPGGENHNPLNTIAMEVLAQVRAERPPDDPSVFGYRDFSRGFSHARQRAGLVGVTLHTLRHTFATRLVMAGVPLATVKELLGHTSIEMTMRYTHAQLEHLRSAVERLVPVPEEGASHDHT